MVTLSSTTAIDHGRRDGARSPRLLSSGTASKRTPIKAGPRIITQPSSCGGINASNAKYQSRYQSGRGSALRMLGSGGLSSGGGPAKYASNTMTTINPGPNTKSSHQTAAQNGTPSSRIN